MARRALLVGINDYRGIRDLRGCLNDISNMRNILKTCLGFRNNDIRVLVDARATKENILHRLRYMVRLAEPGDFMMFHFSGHGAQIRDRNGDELQDGMDELICPWDFNWDGRFVLDDDFDEIFRKLPEGSLLEVILDCCHSGDGTTSLSRSAEHSPMGRYISPPPDIAYRYEGEEPELTLRGFTSANRSGNRSTMNHILWSACRSDQESADAYINGNYNGAFTYYFCKHMRETGGYITRRNLLERVQNSLRYNRYPQSPQLACMNDAAFENRPFQFPSEDEPERMLFLTTPYMRGDDVKRMQQGLKNAGFRIVVDGVFGPHTHKVIKQFQEKNEILSDGVVGPIVRSVLFD
ncbi:caspase family protein [Desulfonema magnum]|uniref:Peptidoglycan binding domain-containing protein n=1 Tax=Desulfonema magnum TaxID=45655 RepID=A0A975BVJ8_9BACT|nr:caspase family protein [Desulfonema magnum]QTA92167.1 Putative peptidoglycan binding domain-containing protein [Desulfonema magnum]